MTMTLTEKPPAVDLTPGPGLRRLAVSAIACGQTAEELRRPPADPRRRALAIEVEALMARGMTRDSALRVIRRLDRGRPCAPFDADAARQVAEIFLAVGIGPAGYRASNAMRGTPRERRTCRMIVAAMGEIAEGAR